MVLSTFFASIDKSDDAREVVILKLEDTENDDKSYAGVGKPYLCTFVENLSIF